MLGLFKPQQKLRILKAYLLPRFLLVPGHLRQTENDQQEQSGRGSWMRLSHDIPLGYFQRVDQGGPDIMFLETRNPELVRSRFDSLAGSSAMGTVAVLSSGWSATKKRWCKMARHGGMQCQTT